MCACVVPTTSFRGGQDGHNTLVNQRAFVMAPVHKTEKIVR